MVLSFLRFLRAPPTSVALALSTASRCSLGRFFARAAVALHTVLGVPDAFFLVLCPHVGLRVLMTAVAGEALEVVAGVAGDAARVVIPVEHEEPGVLEGCRLPGGRGVALAAIALDLTVQGV